MQGLCFFGRRACACEVDVLFVQSGERLPLRSEPTVRGLHTLRADGLGLCFVFLAKDGPLTGRLHAPPAGRWFELIDYATGRRGVWCTYLATVVLRRPMLPEDALGHNSPGSSPGSPYG